MQPVFIAEFYCKISNAYIILFKINKIEFSTYQNGEQQPLYHYLFVFQCLVGRYLLVSR